MNHNYFIYILTNQSGTLYVGVTNNLERRVSEHKLGIVEGFTKKYGCDRLVYFENGNDINGAIKREKQIKKYSRIKKINLIKSVNPAWVDLSLKWFQ